MKKRGNRASDGLVTIVGEGAKGLVPPMVYKNVGFTVEGNGVEAKVCGKIFPHACPDCEVVQCRFNPHYINRVNRKESL